MKAIFILFFFAVTTTLVAQLHPTCDGMRYRTDVFTQVSSTTALQYGSGVTIGGNAQDLFLDIYEPVGDMAESRPAIVLAFGGSYIGGERTDLDWLCEALAKKGFVAVTIDYRLYDLPLFPFPTEEEMQEVVAKSLSDMKAAIRFLREDADTDNLFKVDTDLIFAGGISAGAITAAHTAILDSTDTFTDELWAIIEDNGGIDGNSSDNLQYSSEVQGLVNFSGGLNDASWIDSEDPPFISFHDEFDGTVPYGVGFASILFVDIIYMEGSQVMNEAADSAGILNELHTIDGSNGHVSYFIGDQSTQNVLDTTSLFLHDIICQEMISRTPDFEKNLSGITLYPNPTAGMLFIKNENDFSLHVTLYNAMGQKLAYWENTNQINLGYFERGIYFIQIEKENSTARIMKRVVVGQ